jgi:uncharacterized protein DUF6049
VPGRREDQAGRPLLAVVLALAVLGLPALLAPAAASAATVAPAGAAWSSAAQNGSDPLRVSMSSLTPSALTPGTPIRVTGTVTNPQKQTWTALQVYLVLSPSPMTSRSQLAGAIRSPDDAPVGNRVVETGRFAQIGDLRPGASRGFTLNVPYRDLGISGAPGVYWIGVQVLATAPDGTRDVVADARARTFIPLLAAKPAPVRLAMLWPVTAPVPLLRGSVFANDSLGASMAPRGRLFQLLHMSAGDGTSEVSWLVDPAVLDAAARMSHGYVVENAGGRRSGPSVVAANDWLNAFRRQVRGRSVFTLPYGDPDIASLVHARLGRFLQPGMTAAQQVANASGLTALSTMWPVNGLADRAILTAAQRVGASLTVVSQQSLPPGTPVRNPVVSIPTAGQPAEAVITDPSLFAGGPGPGQTHNALQVRQRILSETALVSMASRPGHSSTLIAVAPRDWQPGALWSQAKFFKGLDVPWLSLVPLTDLLSTPGRLPAALVYPATMRSQEQPTSRWLAVRTLSHVSATLVDLLTRPANAIASLDRQLGLACSVQWRTYPATGSALTTEQIRRVRGQLQKVSVQASDFVTLSSSSGRFPVTITNGLKQAVTVGLSVVPTNPQLRIDPVPAVTVGSGQRTTFTVTARADRVGLTNVTVRPLTAEHHVFGRHQLIKVRATQYAVVVWVILGLVFTVLVGTSAYRIVRRLRARRRGLPLPDAA